MALIRAMLPIISLQSILAGMGSKAKSLGILAAIFTIALSPKTC
jgi:hypothetical protein